MFIEVGRQANLLPSHPSRRATISPALEGQDVIGTAQTGTGNTFAFLIPIIEMLRAEPLKHESAKHESAKHVSASCRCPRVNWPCKFT